MRQRYYKPLRRHIILVSDVRARQEFNIRAQDQPRLSWSSAAGYHFAKKSAFSLQPVYLHSYISHWLYLGLRCCCSVIKSYPNLWDPIDCSMPGSLSFTISQSFLRFMSIESVMPSNQLTLCHPFSSCPKSFPASVSFPVSRLFASSAQSTPASISALPINFQV